MNILTQNLISTQTPMFLVVGIGLLITLITLLIIFVIKSLCDWGYDNDGGIVLGCLCGILIILIIAFAPAYSGRYNYETYYQYKVTLNDKQQIDLNRYKIIGNEGKIITIQDVVHQEVKR